MSVPTQRGALALTLLGLLCASGAAQTNEIVINEFNTGTPDFIEIRNCGTQTVDVSGWTVQSFYATSSGSTTLETAYVLPSGTSIAPGGFLVLQEFGTAGQPGSLPSSISVGFNYFWVANRTVGMFVLDAAGSGVDYVYRNVFGNPAAANLPAGTSWTGSLTSGTGDEVTRIQDADTDTAADWSTQSGSGTPAALNPGQLGGSCIPVVVFEQNSAEAHLDIDGVMSNGFTPAVVSKEVGLQSTVNIQSTLTGNGYDVAVVAASLVPGNQPPAINTANGQIVNVDLTDPSLFFLNSGTSTINMQPFPGNQALNVAISSAITLSAQMVIADPAHPDGIQLSQGSQLEMLPCGTTENFDGLSSGVNAPMFWTNPSSGMGWTVNSGGTTSTGTGPTAANSLPNYIYCETSGSGSTGTFVMDTCNVSLTSLASFTLNFQLSRIGGTIGTLNIWQDDDGAGTFPTLLATYTGADPTQSQGGVEWSAESIPFVPGGTSTVAFRFDYAAGGSFTGDLAIDDYDVQ